MTIQKGDTIKVNETGNDRQETVIDVRDNVIITDRGTRHITKIVKMEVEKFWSETLQMYVTVPQD